MKTREQRLAEFGKAVLAAMEDSEEWDADMLDDIAQASRDLGLSDPDENGYFSINFDE